MIVADPRADFQPLIESAYMGIPTIAFCDTDSPLSNVDIAIPCNTKNRKAIGLMFWLLAREVGYLKNEIGRDKEWDVAIDLFLHKDLTDKNKQAIKEKDAAEDEAEPSAAVDTRKRINEDDDDEDDEEDDAEEAKKWTNK